jgi:galactose mutarotase-like enzyme
MSDRIILANEALEIEAIHLGAGLTSLKKNGVEYMGQWRGSNKAVTTGFVMAPVIGDFGKVVHDGVEYAPGKHGYTRETLFAADVRDDGVAFSHTHDPSSQSGIWPFAHKIVVDYQLAADELITAVRLENLGDAPMAFGCGLHPAFKWPLSGSASKDGHILRLLDQLPEGTLVFRPKDGKMRREALVQNPFDAQGAWAIKPDDFIGDAYFFIYPQNITREQRLSLSNGEREMLFTLNGWSGFGIWSKADDSPFICIEPLMGVPFFKTGGDPVPRLEDVDGLATLPPRGVFKASMRIGFTPSAPRTL